jgi:hypothetical protein
MVLQKTLSSKIHCKQESPAPQFTMEIQAIITFENNRMILY